jgi:hypothetical protein
MGTISSIDPHGANLVHTLKRLHADAVAGKISGAVILAEYNDSYELEMPGVFSTDPDDIVQIVGRLQIANHYFATASFMAALEDVE